MWRSRVQAEKEEAARRRRKAEVEAARAELARLEQERSPDIDNEVRRVVLCRLADDAATAAFQSLDKMLAVQSADGVV